MMRYHYCEPLLARLLCPIRKKINQITVLKISTQTGLLHTIWLTNAPNSVYKHFFSSTSFYKVSTHICLFVWHDSSRFGEALTDVALRLLILLKFNVRCFVFCYTQLNCNYSFHPQHYLTLRSTQLINLSGQIRQVILRFM